MKSLDESEHTGGYFYEILTRELSVLGREMMIKGAITRSMKK